MKNFTPSSKEILCMLICLKALNISQNTLCKVFTQKYNSKKINFYKPFYYNKAISYKNKIWTIYHMLEAITYQATVIQKIFSILAHYSKQKSSFNKIVYLISYKYVKRFIYNFQKLNKYNMYTKTEQLEILALVNLYIIYKLSKTKNIFFLYKKLATKTM